MATFELARFTVKADDVDLLLKRWPAAVEAIGSACPGLIEANLVRLDETTWIDIWRWETHELAVSAAQEAPSIPAAAEMFSLISGPPTMEHGEVVMHKQVGERS
ncbi:MAG: hypothetical protein AAGA75_00960 [Cyanobacteria bacterium P01_E01_bin.6]